MSLQLHQLVKQVSKIISHRPNPLRDAEEIVCHFAGLTRSTMLSNLFLTLEQKVIDISIEAAERISNHYPLEYILGYADFLGIRLKIDENVLIPRSDTETLVIETEKIIEQIKSNRIKNTSNTNKDDKIRVLDMCTGSGCIAVSLKKRNPELEVIASDISPESLAVAKENSQTCGAEITFVESDCFNNIEGRFDIITCNPPYIKTSLLPTLEKEISHEPRLALDGGESGMDFYEKIASSFKNYLKPDGVLFLEVESQDVHTINNLRQLFSNSDIDLIADMSNRPRVAIIKETR